MKKTDKIKRKRAVSVGLGIFVFILSFGAGVASKILLKPSWANDYSVKWSEKIGTLKSDIAYGDGEANKFDLYLPKDNSKENYGLVVYLHAGGFTTGDKKDDENTLAWLCSKGYVAAGINYTLRTDENPDASVLSQSNEIKEAIPAVVHAAKEAGYNVDKMTMAGGSAGHALAMIYTYRDGKEAPVPVVLTYGAVGPSSFVTDDWGIFGINQDTDESRQAAAQLFSILTDGDITAEDIKDGSYRDKVHDISAAEWVSNNPVPTVIAYGVCDKVQPFEASKRLVSALKENNVDYKYFVMEHSGHALQNDNAESKLWMEAVDEYLAKYMPVK